MYYYNFIQDMLKKGLEPDVFNYSIVINTFKDDHVCVQRLWNEMQSGPISDGIVMKTCRI